MADAHQIPSLCQGCLLWYSILTTVFSARLQLGKLTCKSQAELRTVAELKACYPYIAGACW